MKKLSSAVRCVAVLFFLAQFGSGELRTQPQNPRPRRIAVFGSSVANGTGDEFGREGYTGLLRQLLQPRGWEVLNQSRGGDTTKTMAPRFAPEGPAAPNVRYLLPVHPGYVVIGLSLANEGIWEAKTKEDKEGVFQQYAEGIKGFVTRSRQNNIVPIVALVYPRMVYTPVEYEYVRRMNLLQNTWDVPTVNLLGALDDGTGRYTSGFDFDDKHPNAAGHHEFLYAFVPTLFDALEKGKPTPAKSAARGFARVSDGTAPLEFVPPDTMHSFAISFMVRARREGAVATIGGSKLAAKNEVKKNGPREFESMTLTADGKFSSSISVLKGGWAYTSGDGVTLNSTVRADDQWHHVVLSHYTARGETLFYVDGKLAGKVAERLEPNRFVLGGSSAGESSQYPRQTELRDLFLFRAALNADEVAVLHDGKLLQASLEIYAPLTDARFRAGDLVENRAQSLSAFKVGTSRIVHVEDASR